MLNKLQRAEKIKFLFFVPLYKFCKMILKIKICSIILFMLLNKSSFSQSTVAFNLNNSQMAESTAVDPTLNFFENTASLDQLFNKLYQLKQNNSNQKVVFTHIGDSHIQADKMTTIVRNELQNYFGNAGRGLIFPFQLAKTNGPTDIKSTSKSIWTSSRLSKINNNMSCGIAAYGIASNDSNSEINFKLVDSLKNSFNQIDLFFNKGLKSVSVVLDGTTEEVAVDSTSQFLSFKLPRVTTALSVQLHASTAQSILFFGASAQNNTTSGIIYNAIGANGAKISDYNNAPIFWEQLPYLNTDCYIVSLGTNEAQNQKLNIDDYLNQLDLMVKKVKYTSPNAPIIFISPPVSYFKKIKPNKTLSIITDILKQFCAKNNIVFYDLYHISKGPYGATTWRKQKLLNTDLVHFTNAGYTLQGALLTKAFAKAYNDFVSTIKN